MAQSTSAEFLTFMRYARPSTFSRSLVRSTQRPFLAQSIRGYAGQSGESGGSNTHATDKGGLDVQSDNAKAARENPGSSVATSGADKQNSQKKAKEEYPEAPKGPVIGMQDERGGKGV